MVNFEGADVEDLEKAFREAVDDYCEKLGRAPDREYSGRIPLRIDGALHRRVAIAADSEAKSVNSWIADALEAATTPRRSDPFFLLLPVRPEQRPTWKTSGCRARSWSATG